MRIINNLSPKEVSKYTLPLNMRRLLPDNILRAVENLGCAGEIEEIRLRCERNASLTREGRNIFLQLFQRVQYWWLPMKSSVKTVWLLRIPEKPTVFFVQSSSHTAIKSFALSELRALTEKQR